MRMEKETETEQPVSRWESRETDHPACPDACLMEEKP